MRLRHRWKRMFSHIERHRSGRDREMARRHERKREQEMLRFPLDVRCVSAVEWLTLPASSSEGQML